MWNVQKKLDYFLRESETWKKFFSQILLKKTILEVILCEKSIARIPEAWKYFPKNLINKSFTRDAKRACKSNIQNGNIFPCNFFNSFCNFFNFFCNFFFVTFDYFFCNFLNFFCNFFSCNFRLFFFVTF